MVVGGCRAPRGYSVAGGIRTREKETVLRPVSHVVQPSAIIVMGVSGSGKSTLGAMIVAQLDCPFIEGDAIHALEAIAKMRSGEALTDADRWPWLDRLGAAITEATQAHGLVVAACSALRRCYRDRLRAAIPVPTRFVLLDIDRARLATRLARRADHFMPASLLDSQLAALEPPMADELAVVLDGTDAPADLCAATLDWLRQDLGHQATAPFR